MATIPRMISAVREEAVAVTVELASTAQVAAVEGVTVTRTAIGDAVNPLAVRQAVEANVKESLEGSSRFPHLSETFPAPVNVSNTSLQHTSSFTPGSISSAPLHTVVTQVLKQDANMTLKEAMSNAAETGAQEQVDKFTDTPRGQLHDYQSCSPQLQDSHTT
ncbi:hypothetical protein L204_100956 [Cryptococcus depauperatus]